MTLPASILLAHAGATLVMVGVIWFVQLVHYPLLGRAQPADFAAYQAENVRRTSWVVVPPMLVEAATALALVALPSPLVPAAEARAGLGLLAAVWASTFLVQVPLHDRLGAGFDAEVHRRLVRTNLLRSCLWTARGALVLGWLGSAPALGVAA